MIETTEVVSGLWMSQYLIEVSLAHERKFLLFCAQQIELTRLYRKLSQYEIVIYLL